MCEQKYMKTNVLRYRRKDFKRIRKLSKSELNSFKILFEAGLIPPIIVRGKTVIDGRQRLETARLLGFKQILVKNITFQRI